MPTPIEVPPSVWVLLGDKAGDNAQAIAVAEALGWPYQAKQLRWNRFSCISNALLGSSLANLDHSRSDRLQPPWPDLVIGVGRRSVPAARWIRRRSGGRAKLVRIGRPRAALALFDLVVTTPQYGLPERPNVLQLSLPLIALDRGRMGDAARAWETRLAHLPRPWYALLVGGRSDPFTVTEEAGRQAAMLVERAAAEAGGSVLVSTSRRTPAAVVEQIAAVLQRPHHLHRWREQDPDNPYLAYLVLADAIYVTSDSATMLAEAYATGKPVRVLTMPLRRRSWLIRALRVFPRWVARRSRAMGAGGPDLLGAFARWLIGVGLVRPRRDMERLLQELATRGAPEPEGAGFSFAERRLVVSRIRALMPAPEPGPAEASGSMGSAVS